MNIITFLRGKMVLLYTSKITYKGCLWLNLGCEKHLHSKVPAFSKQNNLEWAFQYAVTYYITESAQMG